MIFLFFRSFLISWETFLQENIQLKFWKVPSILVILRLKPTSYPEMYPKSYSRSMHTLLRKPCTCFWSTHPLERMSQDRTHLPWVASLVTQHRAFINASFVRTVHTSLGYSLVSPHTISSSIDAWCPYGHSSWKRFYRIQIGSSFHSHLEIHFHFTLRILL